MNWIEKTVLFLFPTLQISDATWRDEWDQRHQSQFIGIAKLIFPLMSISYIANYFLFDVPMGLEPTEHWFRFRSIVAIMLMIIGMFYYSPLRTMRHYKWPAVLCCIAVCYSQGLVVIWYGN